MCLLFDTYKKKPIKGARLPLKAAFYDFEGGFFHQIDEPSVIAHFLETTAKATKSPDIHTMISGPDSSNLLFCVIVHGNLSVNHCSFYKDRFIYSVVA